MSASNSLTASDLSDIRSNFPIFEHQPGRIFFDNASTAQKPHSVISTISEFYSRYCSNAGRASYQLSTVAKGLIEETRKMVADFIGASENEIIFTSGATESLKLIALSWGLNNLSDGDEVMVCFNDHQAAVNPWIDLQEILARFGLNIVLIPFETDNVGDYDLASVRAGLSSRTKLINITHIHHVFGQDINVKDIRQVVGDKVLISLDASQSIGHFNMNVKELDVDFLSFSGHKMFAGNGVGGLWINKKVHQKLKPAFSDSSGQVADSFDRFKSSIECGTANIPSILSLSTAINFINSIGLQTIEKHLLSLTQNLYDQLKDLPGISFSPGIHYCSCTSGFGIVSFKFDRISCIDMGVILDNENVLVRDGGMCLSRTDSFSDYLRVSFHIYNTYEEVGRFIKTLRSYIQ